jgi:hypothetical protein
MIEYVKLAVDLLKGLAWPVAFFGTMFLFRVDVRALLPRLIKAGPTGMEFERQPQTLSQPWSGELNKLPNNRPRTAITEEIEKSLHAALQTIKDDQRIDVLVNELAVSRLHAVFERIYGPIYGSQIAGLRALVSAGGRVPMSDAVNFFNEVKSRQPDLPAAIDFSSWSGYLQNSNLIKVENDSVEITELGREFLLYLPLANLRENRPF